MIQTTVKHNYDYCININNCDYVCCVIINMLFSMFKLINSSFQNTKEVSLKKRNDYLTLWPWKWTFK